MLKLKTEGRVGDSVHEKMEDDGAIILWKLLSKFLN